MNEILTTHELVCGYDTPVLGPLDLNLPEGVFVLLEGPNGIGKSTFLETVAGLHTPLSGSYTWTVEEHQRRFVPQVRTLDPILPATVEDVVTTGRQQGLWAPDADDEAVTDALSRVDMHAARHDLFRELSEGQKQLVLLARALVGAPRLVLLDEPTASMDPDRERRAFEILEQRCATTSLTVFVVAHGSRPARRAADVLIEIDAGRNVDVRSIRH